MQAVTHTGFIPLFSATRVPLSHSQQVPVEVHCFISQGGTASVLTHLSACKNMQTVVIALLYESEVTPCSF